MGLFFSLRSLKSAQDPLHLFPDVHPLAAEVLHLQRFAPGQHQLLFQLTDAARQRLLFGREGPDPFFDFREPRLKVFQIALPSFIVTNAKAFTFVTCTPLTPALSPRGRGLG